MATPKAKAASQPPQSIAPAVSDPVMIPSMPSEDESFMSIALECAARGIPAITSDLAGFGTYLMQHMPDHTANGLFVLHRRQKNFNQAADELTEMMLAVARLERRERIALRNRVESTSEHFDWDTMGRFYAEAHEMALSRAGAR